MCHNGRTTLIFLLKIYVFMIKKHVLLSILGLFIACTLGAQDNSMADEKAIVKSGNMRFTVLTHEMIRIVFFVK